MRTSTPTTTSFGNKPKRNTTMLVIALCAVLLSVVSCIGWFTNRRKLVKTRIQLENTLEELADTIEPIEACTHIVPDISIENCNYSDGMLSFSCIYDYDESKDLEIKVLEYQGHEDYSYRTIFTKRIYIQGYNNCSCDFSYHVSPIYSYDGVDPVVEIWMDGWLVGGGSVDAPEGVAKAAAAAADAAAPATK